MATTPSDMQSLIHQAEADKLSAHNTFSLAPKRAHCIEARWQEWRPACILAARRSGDIAGDMHLYRTRHRSRLIACLSASLAWDTIREHRLDDPIVDDARFNFVLRAAIERRRCRMGRVKGIRKSQSKKYPALGGRS